jgi:spore germination protein YaaH
MKKYDLAGLSMWALGKETASFWQAVEAGLQ